MASEKKVGFWRRLGAFIEGLRRWTLNLLFLFGLGVLIFAFVQEAPRELPDKAILVLAPEGAVVDEFTAVDVMSQLAGSGPTETRLLDLIDAVERARKDDRITGMLIRLHHLDHIGISKALELAESIDRFRQTGKTVTAVSDYYDQDQYLLATQADKIYFEPMGGVGIEGFAVVRNYFRQAIEKLKIEFHVFKVGSYKSALEPLIRDDMSPEAKRANRGWLDPLWSVYRETVIQRRGITGERFDAFVNHIDEVMIAVDGDAEKAALEYGLVDGVMSRLALRDYYSDEVGVDSDGYFHQMHYLDYLHHARRLELTQPENGGVGVIIARGTIVDGEAPAGGIGGDSLARLVRQAVQDETVKAVVLRIDSGGGSAMASEVIRQELLSLKKAGKPFVVSMGSAAASGGYWISADADEIWATPATLTGSIGIFGAFPTFEKLLGSVGIATDGVGTTDVAGALRIDKPLSPVLERAMQSGIENGYRRFLTVVAQGRNKSLEQVAEVAEGRVWGGMDALELGLVDKLGSMKSAIDSAAEMAGVSPRGARILRLPRSPEEELLALLTGRGLLKQGMLGDTPLLSEFSRWLTTNRAFLDSSNMLNDPRGLHAYCVMCSAL